MDVMPIVVVIAVVGLASMAVRIVPAAQACNVERLGRYTRTLGPGVGVVVPFVERVRPPIDLRQQRLAVGPEPVVLADSQVVEVTAIADIRVVDPRAAGYEVADYRKAVEILVVTALRNLAGSRDRAKISSSWVELSLLESVKDSARHWGIEVDRIELDSVSPLSR
jgi:regulator of protease activity HflC (stomatin/prohibitin superfamily)